MYSQVAVGSVAADANSGPATVNVGFLIMGRLVAVPWAGYRMVKDGAFLWKPLALGIL